MPVVIAVLVRAIIQAAVSLGVLSLAERILLPLVNKAIEEVAQFFGVSEEDSKDIVANEILQFAESVGVLALTLRSKLPLKVAERLGFTAKGFSKRLLTGKAAQAAQGTTPAAIATVDSSVAAAKIAETISQNLPPSLFARVNEIVSFITKVVGLPVGVLFTLAQFIDFGNWNSGAYQKTFQKILSKFGLVPDKDAPSSNVLSDDMWKRLLGTYNALGAVSITDPETGQEKIFSNESLRAIADRIAARVLLEKGKVSLAEMIGGTQALITFGTPVTDAKLDRVLGIAQETSVASPQTPFTQISIEGLPFGQIIIPPIVVEKITSMSELTGVIKNSIAAFANAIPDRISFEISLTKFWVDPQGQIITPNPPAYIERSKTSTGETSRTVQNKIAVLNVYFSTHEAKRVKIFAWPLDYSVADNVITGPPETGGSTIPVVVDVLRQIISQPVAAATPSVSPATSFAPTSPVITPPSGGSSPSSPVPQASNVTPVVVPTPTPVSNAGTYPRNVTVNVDAVMVRAAPNSTAPLTGSQRLTRGTSFVVTNYVTGENVSGENRWWISQFGNYVWVGGTTEKP